MTKVYFNVNEYKAIGFVWFETLDFNRVVVLLFGSVNIANIFNRPPPTTNCANLSKFQEKWYSLEIQENPKYEVNVSKYLTNLEYSCPTQLHSRFQLL